MTFESAYAGQPLWDIGRPNKVLVDAADRITGSVLDAGCGTGENTPFFASRGCQVTGIDFIEEAINRATRSGRVWPGGDVLGQTRLRAVLPSVARSRKGTCVAILNSQTDDVVPFADSEELARNSGAMLIEVGGDHRLAELEPLEMILVACGTHPNRPAAPKTSTSIAFGGLSGNDDG